MRLFKKSIIFVFSFIFIGVTTLYAGWVDDELKLQYLNKARHDYPHVVSSSITVTFFNASELIYPEGSQSYEFSFPEGSSIMGRTLLPLVFLDSLGQPIKRIKIAAEVQGKAYYYRSRSLLKRRHRITEADIEQVLLDSYAKPSTAGLTYDDIIGQEVKATISKHTILTESMIQIPKVIRKGDRVLVVLDQKGVSLRLTGRAMDDGALKEDIRVKLGYKTQRILQGEVINENTVSIPFMY